MSAALQNSAEPQSSSTPVRHVQAPVSSQYVDQAVSIIKEEIDELCTQIGLLLDGSEEDVDESEVIDEKLTRSLIFKLKELGAAMRFARFSVLSKLVLSMADAIDKKLQRDRRVSSEQRAALFTNCQLLSAYVNVSMELEGPELGLIIAPAFHRMAKAGLIPHTTDAALFLSEFSMLESGSAGSALEFELQESDIDQLKRSRQMFQIALISLLRGQGTEQTYNLVTRVCSHNQGIGDERYQVLWREIGKLVGYLKAKQVQPDAQRNYVFALCDRLLRSVINGDQIKIDESPAREIFQEVELLLVLAEGATHRGGDRLGTFSHEPTLTEKELCEHRQKIETGLGDALQAVAVSCSEKLAFCKNKLTTFDPLNLPMEKDFEAVRIAMQQTKMAASFSKLQHLAEKVSASLAALEEWLGAPSEAHFEALASQLVAAENSSDWLAKNQVNLKQLNCKSGYDTVDDPHLEQAKIQLCSEIQANISLAIRGLSVYAESGWDPQHIANLDKALLAASSGFEMLEYPSIADLLQVCATRLNQQAACKAGQPASDSVEVEKNLSLIADCLVTADALIHEVKVGRKPSAIYQDIVKQSIEQLSTSAD